MTERAHPRRIKSYVTRAGRVSAAQERALAALAPVFGLPFQKHPLAREQVFGRHAPLVVEIGFGMGETTALLAEQRPEVDFIGIEVHTPGVGALYKMIGARGIGNVRIIQHDAVEIFEWMFEPASLAGIHVFFPDPWHKARHHKRRLINPAFAALLASRLTLGGYLHLATDWEDYATQMLEVLAGRPELVNQGTPYAPPVNPLFARPRTKFEARGLKLGHEVRDLVFTRAS